MAKTPVANFDLHSKDNRGRIDIDNVKHDARKANDIAKHVSPNLAPKVFNDAEQRIKKDNAKITKMTKALKKSEAKSSHKSAAKHKVEHKSPHKDKSHATHEHKKVNKQVNHKKAEKKPEHKKSHVVNSAHAKVTLADKTHSTHKPVVPKKTAHHAATHVTHKHHIAKAAAGIAAGSTVGAVVTSHHTVKASSDTNRSVKKPHAKVANKHATYKVTSADKLSKKHTSKKSSNKAVKNASKQSDLNLDNRSGDESDELKPTSNSSIYSDSPYDPYNSAIAKSISAAQTRAQSTSNSPVSTTSSVVNTSSNVASVSSNADSSTSNDSVVTSSIANSTASSTMTSGSGFTIVGNSLTGFSIVPNSGSNIASVNASSGSIQSISSVTSQSLAPMASNVASTMTTVTSNAPVTPLSIKSLLAMLDQNGNTRFYLNANKDVTVLSNSNASATPVLNTTASNNSVVANSSSQSVTGTSSANSSNAGIPIFASNGAYLGTLTFNGSFISSNTSLASPSVGTQSSKLSNSASSADGFPLMQQSIEYQNGQPVGLATSFYQFDGKNFTPIFALSNGFNPAQYITNQPQVYPTQEITSSAVNQILSVNGYPQMNSSVFQQAAQNGTNLISSKDNVTFTAPVNPTTGSINTKSITAGQSDFSQSAAQALSKWLNSAALPSGNYAVPDFEKSVVEPDAKSSSANNSMSTRSSNVPSASANSTSQSTGDYAVHINNNVNISSPSSAPKSTSVDGPNL